MFVRIAADTQVLCCAPARSAGNNIAQFIFHEIEDTRAWSNQRDGNRVDQGKQTAQTRTDCLSGFAERCTLLAVAARARSATSS